MSLRRIDKHSTSDNELYESAVGTQRRLVKVYRGRRAQARRDREIATLRAWREAGFGVPEVFEQTVEGVQYPYAVLELLEGRSLREALADTELPSREKQAMCGAVLEAMRRRHDEALASGDANLAHGDANSSNVILTSEGVCFLDLEAPPADPDTEEACVLEIAKFCRWTLRDLDDSLRVAFVAQVVAAYEGRHDLLWRAADRTRQRSFQWFHRWRDRRHKQRHKKDVTKYDVSDGLGRALAKIAQRPDLPMPARGLCAYRGLPTKFPENTLAGVRRAAEFGSHMVEFDVRLCRSGELVLMHDATLDRTTNRRGRVKALTLTELASVGVGAGANGWTTERIATLQEALDIMPPHVWVNVHVKDATPAAARAAAEIIARQGRAHQAFVTCGSAKALAAARKAVPSILTCAFHGGRRTLRDCDIAHCQFIEFYRGMPQAHEIDRVRARGLRVNLGEANRAGDLEGLFARGIDFALVDDVETMLPIALAAGIEPVKTLPAPRGQANGVADPLNK